MTAIAQPLAELRVEDDPEADARVAVTALRRIADAWKLTDDEAAALAGLTPQAWARPAPPARLEPEQLLRASGLVGLYKALHLYFSDALADAWPGRPNAGRLFAGRSPVTCMRDGGLPAILAVRGYVDALRGGV